ncbi:hypothetical protein [Chlamydiifrater phoenicopteri]|uniref:hypothetical protein n=1 Tax=Chlamydiifrater phoenicopteri TaxID=2681469 RepID=UPI001BCDACBD|nr:hypothetical protein [Chlamydiifrater phoenicopteri]
MEDSFFFDTLSISDLKKQESWEAILSKVPLLPRGWFELAGLSHKERLELCCQFWLSRLDLSTEALSFIMEFFSTLDALEVFAYRISSLSPFQPCLLYLGKEGKNSFVGYPPVQPSGCVPSFCGDRVYANFFYIHDGFGNFEDKGILSTKDLAKASQKLRKLLIEEGKFDETEDCYSLGVFPFYEGASPDNYQCFLVNPEVCKSLPSPNMFFSKDNLHGAGDVLLGIKPFFSENYHYSSFLDWFKKYLLGEIFYSDC